LNIAATGGYLEVGVQDVAMNGYPLRISGARTLWGVESIRRKMEAALPKNELCDNELVAHVLRGDRAFFKELVDRYQKRAYLFARGMVHNSDDAYDLSQEAFVRAYKNLKKFDKAYPFKVWLFHILSNLCKNHLRQKRTRARVMVDSGESAQQAVSATDSPDAAYQKSQTQAVVREAIARLPEKFREIIILSHFQEMSYEQMAQVLDIPRGSVMSRLYYARLKLREILEEMGVEL
jgi:RNA polymerase sigma-70 factor (ECF subfamily)